jgi:non-ribosomal peptide synthetase component F
VVQVDDVTSATAVPRAPGMARRLCGPRLDLPDETLLTVPGLLFHVAELRAAQPALRVKRRGLYRETKWRDLADQVTRIGRGLIALAVQPGERVAIVGDPSPEWLLADFAVQCLGAVSYGLYPTSARDEVEFVLRHAGASVLIAQDQEHVDKVLPMLDRLLGLRKLVVIDHSNMFGYGHPALLTLRELIDRLHFRHQRASERRPLHASRADHARQPIPRLPGARRRPGYPQRRTLAAQSSVRARQYAARHAGEGDHSPFQ